MTITADSPAACDADCHPPSASWRPLYSYPRQVWCCTAAS